MAAILSQLVREGRLSVIEELKLDAPKTKQLVEKIKGFGFSRVMIITDKFDENLYLSSRNLPDVFVTDVAGADPVNLVRFPRVVLTRDAVKKIEEALVCPPLFASPGTLAYRSTTARPGPRLA